MARRQPVRRLVARCRTVERTLRDVLHHHQFQRWTGRPVEGGAERSLMRAYEHITGARACLNQIPTYSREWLVGAAVGLPLLPVIIATVLLTVSDPSRPWVIGLAVSAGFVLAAVIGEETRALVTPGRIAAIERTVAVGPDSIVGLGTELRAIRDALDPAHEDQSKAMRSLSRAIACVDEVDRR